MTTSDHLSLRQLELLAALAEHGSFTRAARALGLSQSTVSEHVRELEQRLGLQLAERGRGHVRLTAAGLALLPHARAALRAEAHVRQAAAELTGVLSGQLTVGASTIPATYLVPGMLARFRAAHPQVALALRTANSRATLALLHEGELDVAVVGIEPPPRPALRAHEVGHDELVLVCAPGHAWARGKAPALAAIAAAPMVAREAGSGTWSAACRLLGAEPRQIVVEVGSTEAAKAAVRAGLGITLLSSLAVTDECAAGLLVQRRLPGVRARRALYLATRPEPHVSPAARAFAAQHGAG